MGVLSDDAIHEPEHSSNERLSIVWFREVGF